jgi:hypothetical protein
MSIPMLTEVFLIEWEPKVVKGGGETTPQKAGHLGDIDKMHGKYMLKGGGMVKITIDREDVEAARSAVEYAIQSAEEKEESHDVTPWVKLMRTRLHYTSTDANFEIPADVALELIAGAEFVSSEYGEDLEKKLKTQLDRQNVKAWWK